MARVISSNDFSGPNERAVAELLAQELPADWVLICNKQIQQRDHSRETDFICIGRRTIFVIEEKGWSGSIQGTENGWLVHGELRKNPINQCEMSSKMLAGILKNRNPRLNDFGSNLVLGIVIVSSPSAQLNISDCRAKTQVFLLVDAVRELTRLDRERDTPIQETLRRDIEVQLTRMPSRPKTPEAIGSYSIIEGLDDQPGCQVFRAQHSDGSKRILKVFHGETALGVAPENDLSIRRQYDSQRKLCQHDLCPFVDPYFTWDDKRALVIPFSEPSGTSFARLAVGGPSPEQILPILLAGFESLAKVHSLGVVHRSLRPDRVWWDHSSGSSGKIRFSDFLIARIEGMETIVDRAEQFDVDHPYRAAECRIDLSQASPKSDVYGLAAVFVNWISGVEPPPDDSWTPDALVNTRKDLDSELFDSIQKILYPALSLEPTGRPTASEIFNSLSELIVRKVKAENDLIESKSSVSKASKVSDLRYEVLELLGKGGTAETFLALDIPRDQLVVLKRLLRPDVHGYLATAEFKALNRLHHPCLPTLIDIYGPEDPYHLKFEYVEGKSLKDTWRELRGATIEEKLKVVERISNDVLDALQYLHENNFLHRDVTPGNILLPVDGDARVLLIDFGLASETSAADSRVGTPLYLAPEIEQSAPKWSSACDLYGLGVLLFELLTDSVPYRVDGSKRLKNELIDVSGDDDQPKNTFAQLLLSKACCPDPSDRFKSASEMRTAIASVFAKHRRRQEEIEVEKISEIDREEPTSPVRVELELSQQINPFVTELRQAFRNSALGNTNNRGMDSQFSRSTYVHTELDDVLLPRIVAGTWKCVALSGNPGDGKTAFLEEVRRELLNKGAMELESSPAGWKIQLGQHLFVSVYDASESHEGMSSNELLKKAITPLSGRTKPEAAFTVLMAINDGRLQDLITAHRLTFRWLCNSLKKQMTSSEKDDDILLIDLKHRAPISATPDGKSLFLGLLDAFVAPSNWATCETCVAFKTCSLRANANALRQPRPREQLVQLLAGVYFLAERRPTIRDLRSALAWIITGDHDCKSVHDAISSVDTIDARYYNLAFDKRAGEDLVIDAFKELDPGIVSCPRLERRLARPNSETMFAQTAVHHPTSTTGSIDRIRDLKRRCYFELDSITPNDLPSPSSLLPSRWLSQFRQLVSGNVELEGAKQQILAGLQRLDRVPSHAAGDDLALRLDSSDDSLLVIRQWTSIEFALQLPNSQDDFLNYLPDHLVLRHVTGWPEMQIGLLMFELLMRAVEGTTPDSVEHQSLLMEFQRFRAQLLTSPTRRVILVTPGGDRSVITSANGKITRLQEVPTHDV